MEDEIIKLAEKEAFCLIEIYEKSETLGNIYLNDCIREFANFIGDINPICISSVNPFYRLYIITFLQNLDDKSLDIAMPIILGLNNNNKGH